MADDLDKRGVSYEYEQHKIKYDVPSREATYTPDLLLPNGIFAEVKGLFDAADRQKHLLIKAQHPALDIRFVFQRSSAPLYKKSPTTYAAWCVKHGFKYADRVVPQEWLREPPGD